MLSLGLAIGSERLDLGRISEIFNAYVVYELMYVWIRLTLGQIPDFIYVEFMFGYWFREASSRPNLRNFQCLCCLCTYVCLNKANSRPNSKFHLC